MYNPKNLKNEAIKHETFLSNYTIPTKYYAFFTKNNYKYRPARDRHYKPLGEKKTWWAYPFQKFCLSIGTPVG